jgi:hypothetical protein
MTQGVFRIQKHGMQIYAMRVDREEWEFQLGLVSDGMDNGMMTYYASAQTNMLGTHLPIQNARATSGLINHKLQVFVLVKYGGVKFCSTEKNTALVNITNNYK